MEIIKGDGSLLKNIDLAPANVHIEVVQNIAIILDTVQNSCPMFRDFGIPGSIYGRPLPVVENLLVGYIYDQIDQHEPRAIISEINFEINELNGKITPIITLEGVKDYE